MRHHSRIQKLEAHAAAREATRISLTVATCRCCSDSRVLLHSGMATILPRKQTREDWPSFVVTTADRQAAWPENHMGRND